jgi:hypothetical protein
MVIYSVVYLSAGNTFVRKKIPARYDAETTEPIYFDIQCGEEGTFYVTFVPRMAGMHAVAVKWQNHHVENSPFRIKVVSLNLNLHKKQQNSFAMGRAG